MDAYTEDRLALVYPELAKRTRRVIAAFQAKTGHEIRVAQGLRTLEDQEAVFLQGREKLADGTYRVVDTKKIVSFAPPGKSWHHFSAVDFSFVGSDPYLTKAPYYIAERLWESLAACCEAEGMVSGFRWAPPKQDRPHAELTFGMTLSRANELHAQGGLKAVWAELDRLGGISA